MSRGHRFKPRCRNFSDFYIRNSEIAFITAKIIAYLILSVSFLIHKSERADGLDYRQISFHSFFHSLRWRLSFLSKCPCIRWNFKEIITDSRLQVSLNMSLQRAKCTREDPRDDGSHDSVLNRVSSESYACACSVATFARDSSKLFYTLITQKRL